MRGFLKSLSQSCDGILAYINALGTQKIWLPLIVNQPAGSCHHQVYEQESVIYNSCEGLLTAEATKREFFYHESWISGCFLETAKRISLSQWQCPPVTWYSTVGLWLRARLPESASALLAACVFVKAEGAKEAKDVFVEGGEEEKSNVILYDCTAKSIFHTYIDIHT